VLIPGAHIKLADNLMLVKLIFGLPFPCALDGQVNKQPASLHLPVAGFGK
jgi:hypothetical protein